MLLDGKIVAITGASDGIGAACALACARQGADVAINYIGDDTLAESVVRRVTEAGRRCLHVKGDVADPDQAPRFVSATVAAFGALDVFVSNAGICPFHAFLDLPADILERTMRVNLHGAFYMVQAAASQMVRQGRGGSIVAISSISALVGGAQQTHYTPTKAGVLSLMQSTAVALGSHGIRCNAVLPGTVETAINRDDLADLDKRRAMSGRVPLGRLGRPEDIAGPVVFFACEALSGYCTGAALLVDGGLFVNLQ
jgi:L-rhamnose 1-dehydrogenase